MHRFPLLPNQVRLISLSLLALFRFAYVLSHLQELLDTRTAQRTGTQLVEEIRKQANDVLPLLITFLRPVYNNPTECRFKKVAFCFRPEVRPCPCRLEFSG